jgi:hypothetical protein
MKASMVFAIVVVSMLSGCGLFPRMAGHCQGHECKVAVSVGADCAITADPDELRVRLGTGPVNIRWKLDPGSGFVFDNQQGITFKPGQNPNNEFDEKRPEDQGKQFHWRDRNTQEGKFRYGITVRDASDPNRVCSSDPLVYNH